MAVGKKSGNAPQGQVLKLECHIRLLLLKRLAQAREAGVRQSRARARNSSRSRASRASNVSIEPAAGVERLLSHSEDWLGRGFIGFLLHDGVRDASYGAHEEQ